MGTKVQAHAVRQDEGQEQTLRTLDPQKQELPTRSTTATRLSQPLILSVASTHDFVLASLDVSGAFLKGLTFEKIRQILAQKGLASPPRRVVIVPPPNVWRHLSSFDPSFNVPEGLYGAFGLECLKPAYGLVDTPLAWQMTLHQFLLEVLHHCWMIACGTTRILTNPSKVSSRPMWTTLPSHAARPSWTSSSS